MSSKPMSQSVIVNPAIFSEAETLERRHRRRLALGWIASIAFIDAFTIYGFNYYMLTAVTLSGFVGRYLYAQIPRSLNAAELSAREIKDMEAKLYGDAEERQGQIGAGLTKLLALPSSEQVAQTSIVTALCWMIWLDLKRPFQVSRLRLQAEGFGAWIISLFGTLPTRSSRLELAIQMARRQASLSKRVLFLSRTKQVFSLWHVVHRPFSYSFALLAIVHILVVLGMGYR